MAGYTEMLRKVREITAGDIANVVDLALDNPAGESQKQAEKPWIPQEGRGRVHGVSFSTVMRILRR